MSQTQKFEEITQKTQKKQVTVVRLGSKNTHICDEVMEIPKYRSDDLAEWWSTDHVGPKNLIKIWSDLKSSEMTKKKKEWHKTYSVQKYFRSKILDGSDENTAKNFNNH